MRYALAGLLGMILGSLTGVSLAALYPPYRHILAVVGGVVGGLVSGLLIGFLSTRGGDV